MLFFPFYLFFVLVACEFPPDVFPAEQAGSIEGLGDALHPQNASLSLLGRQTAVCPAQAPVDCGASGCCLSGQRCCPEGCCATTENCFGQYCCPISAETCGGRLCLESGQTCCGTLACRAGYTCQTAQTGQPACCQPGYFACDQTFCCEIGTTCAGSGLCRGWQSTQTTRQTSILTSTSFKLSYSTSYMTFTRTSVGISQSTYTTTRTSFSALCTPTLGAQASADDNALDQLCDGIPVMFFPLVQGVTEELIDSICNARGDQFVLTWAGDGDAGRRSRSSQAGCKGYCAGLGQSYNARYNGRNECDEVPFASTLEGGRGAHKQCIYYRQNGLGGSFIANYRRLYNLQAGQQFVVKVVPGCPTSSRKRSPSGFWHELLSRTLPQSLALHMELDTRQSTPWAASNVSDAFVTDPRPGSANGSGLVLAPMFDVPGNQNVRINLGNLGQTKYVGVVDSDGTEYFYDESSPSAISFNLAGTSDDTTDLHIVAAYAKSSLASTISYTATGASTATSQASGGGGSVSAGARLRPAVADVMAASCVVAAALAML